VDPGIFVVTLFVSIGTTIIQFLFCLPKKLFFKLVPFLVLIFLWIAAIPTSGFDSLRFVMYLTTSPAIIGMFAGWGLYVLYQKKKQNKEHNLGITPCLINNIYTLNFDESATWTVDFTNRHLIFLAHQFVTVEYKFCSPSDLRAKVTVELFINDDNDGTYDPYAPNGEYLFTLTVGGKYSIALPYGTSVKKYRLVFINQTLSVSSGTFAVKTE